MNALEIKREISEVTDNVEVRRKNDYKGYGLNELLPNAQEEGFVIRIPNHVISVVKWSDEHYNGDWEMWSNGTLFFDVERFATIEEMVERIKELIKKGGEV